MNSTSVPDVAIATRIERGLRRINTKYLVLQYDRYYSFAVYLYLLLVAWRLQSRGDGMIGMVASTLLVTMSITLLFLWSGGTIVRRSASDQGKFLVATTQKVCEDVMEAAVWNKYLTLGVVTVGAELGKLLSTSTILALLTLGAAAFPFARSFIQK